MIRITPLFLILSAIVFTNTLFAQSSEPSPIQPSGERTRQVFAGLLLDADCHMADAAGKCDVAATSKAFGLMLPEGKYLGLDADGNAKAKDALKGKTGAIRASLTGKSDGQMLKVDSIQVE